MADSFRLAGRRILVTGASSGIGRDVAILLSQLDAELILVGRDAERLQQTQAALSGTGHQAECFDLAAGDQIPAWIKTLTADGRPLAGIVHAAGKQLTKPLRSLTSADLDDVMRTNLHSAALLSRGFAQRGCGVPGGSLVFISSVMANVSKPALAAYSASKAALAGLARSLALELASNRIRVNCIAPAFVETEMLQQLREMLPEEQFQALEQAHPLGLGQPRDVAHAAAFLLADASRWITGSTLVIDGGYSIQ